MKWFYQFLRRTKQPEISTRNDPSTGDRAPQPISTIQKKAPDIQLQSSPEIWLPPFSETPCPNDGHNFIRPYPLKCRKCGLQLQWNEEEIEKYMGSYFDGKSYQWTERMKSDDITSFSISCGNRPVFSASCDFSAITVRNCLHGSRDGWRQQNYPQDYFEPSQVQLKDADRKAIKAFLEKCDFTKWKTPVHYVENHSAPGFSVDKSFCCTFADGKQFLCLKPQNEEFDHLICMIRKIVGSNAEAKDRDFVQRMLEDTQKKTKQIYWLISQSMEEKWMKLTAQGAPFFNYMVARELSRGDNANAELMVNVIRFSHGAAWITEQAVPEKEYQWEDLPHGRGNDLGAAFALLTRHFETLSEPGRKLFPIVALVLDGPITDDWMAAQKRFRSLPGVTKNVLTIALVLGDRVEEKFLKNFAGVIYHINTMEDIINELDSPFLGF